MPELSDVQYFKQYLDATSLHKPVKEMVVYTAQVLANITIEELETEVVGRSFAGSDRHGKYLLVELDDGRTLIMHFGMTGHLEYFEDADREPEFPDTFIIPQRHEDGHCPHCGGAVQTVDVAGRTAFLSSVPGDAG